MTTTREIETPPVTGETITDAQIRAVRDAAVKDGDFTLLGTTMHAMRAPGYYFQNGPEFARARARCADAYNARLGARP